MNAAAEAKMMITPITISPSANDLKGFGVIDQVMAEPMGGAHRDPEATIASLGDALAEALDEFGRVPGGELKSRRREKFMEIGRANLA